MTESPYREPGTIVADKPTAAERIAAARSKRDALQAVEETARDEQLANDLEAIADLEAEHGFERIIRIQLPGWTPGKGAPTCVAVRVPYAKEQKCKRFIQLINASKEHTRERIEASEQLGESCMVYPKLGTDEYKAALEIAPLILTHAAAQIVKASQGQVEKREKE